MPHTLVAPTKWVGGFTLTLVAPTLWVGGFGEQHWHPPCGSADRVGGFGEQHFISIERVSKNAGLDKSRQVTDKSR